jgi:Uncharacterised protein family UPF0047
VDTDLLEIDTSRRRIVDLTDAVRSFCGGHGDGLCNVFVPHATVGVAIIIETGAGSDDDLIDTLERLLPRDDRYRHEHGSPGHGPCGPGGTSRLRGSAARAGGAVGDGAGTGPATTVRDVAERRAGRPEQG